ncbi:hypothetical protein M9H77_33699 [Catharanthus roseus]|uniref:Uncharacterized protein n=1 Tax=Catharanthus roseus TaxID=4058 RepID=A0ACB9ZK01_CATRO|nr:hypothetical protein M9H77_33699 [Catharanthus roseus]
MAALQCSASAKPSKSVLGFHRPIPRIHTPSITFLNPGLLQNAPPIHFTFRNNVRLLQLRQSLHSVCASNGSSEGSDVSKSSEDSKGPPFLTILAGFLVFFAVCWVIGSIVMWLIGLFFHLPSSK